MWKVDLEQRFRERILRKLSQRVAGSIYPDLVNGKKLCFRIDTLVLAETISIFLYGVIRKRYC